MMPTTDNIVPKQKTRGYYYYSKYSNNLEKKKRTKLQEKQNQCPKNPSQHFLLCISYGIRRSCKFCKTRKDESESFSVLAIIDERGVCSVLRFLQMHLEF